MERNRNDNVQHRVRKRGGFKRFAKRFVLYTVVGLVVAVCAAVVFVLHFEKGLPSTAQIKAGDYRPPQVTRVLANDGSVLAELFTERRTVVPIEQLAGHVKLAMIAAEDARFFEHEGLNYLGMVRALLVNLKAGKTRQGASTITQQVVKNTLLDPERTYKRKIREALLARRIEQELTKDQILGLYLNQIYFGHGRYGIEEASRYYFGISAKALSLSQAALIAGIVPSPERYSPRKNPSKADERRRFVLGQMLAKGFITAEQHAAALEQAIVLATAQSEPPQLAPEAVEIAKRVLQQVAGQGAVLGGYTITTTIDPSMQRLARQAVRDNLMAFDKRHGLQGPLSPPKNGRNKASKRSGRDVPFEGTPRYEQHKVLVGEVTDTDDEQRVLYVRVGTITGVVRLDDHERYNPKKLLPSKFAPKGTLLRVSLLAKEPEPSSTDEPAAALPEGAAGTAAEVKRSSKSKPSATASGSVVPLRLELGPQSALVALDVRTRQVRALVGNFEGVPGGLDRATQARRQPGSTFKPLVYSYAIHSRRFTPATLVDTRPGSVRGINGRDEGDHAGTEPVRLREGLAKSVNVVAVHVAKQVGPANVVAWAKTLGITTPMGPDLSLPLGAYEVIPIELANAYACFASAGIYQPTEIITSIKDAQGNELRLPALPGARRVMEDNEAYLITSMLTSVIDRGTATKAKGLGLGLAGKTGTTNESKDAWFVGFSTDLVVAVWTGYDDARPLGAREAGSTAALPAWIQFMKGALASKPSTDFARPPSIVAVQIDPKTGLLAAPDQQDAMLEYFLPGTEPTQVVELDAGAEGGLQEEAEHGLGVGRPCEGPVGCAHEKAADGGSDKVPGAMPGSEQGVTQVPSQQRDAETLPAVPATDPQIHLY